MCRARDTARCDCGNLRYDSGWPNTALVINESDTFKSGNDLAAAGDVRNSTATGPSFNPRKKSRPA
eukprot:1335390-Prymnesium_polylepis.1